MDAQTKGDLANLISRLENVAGKFESFVASKGAGSSPAAEESVAPFVLAFDEIINGPLSQYMNLSNQIGGDVKLQADFVKEGFQAQRGFLRQASRCKQPSPEVFMKLLSDTSKQLSAVQELREKNRRSEFFNHLSTVSESIPALGWVTVSPAPGPYVKEMNDAGQFYSNRVIKDFKEKDKTHVEWARAWIGTLTELQAYVKQHHTTGVSWNKQGADASSAPAPAPAPSAAGPGGPPPPPPPPPPPAPEGGKPDGGLEERSQLFSDLNKGADITKSLRKVTDDQKTHKNPKLRTTAQPFKPSPAPKPFKPFGKAAPPTQVEKVVKPPRCELVDKKWLVEHQVDNRNVVVNVTEKKQTVYVYKCTNSTIQVKGKANSIIFDGCKKCGLVFEDLISSLDVINCQSVQAQVTGHINTVSIDKTDGCMVYLSKESSQAEIVTAKSSEMNILVPGDGGEYKEFAVPEQFVTKFVNGKLDTQVSGINQ